MKPSPDLSLSRQSNGLTASHTLTPTRREMVEAGGRFWQMLGLPRSTGQIFGLLYLAPQSLSLDDIVGSLGISKASASTGTRQLMAWEVIKQVWVPGDRRDFFEVVPDLNVLVKAIYHEFIKRRFQSAQMRLDGFQKGLEDEFKKGLVSADEHQLYVKRMQQLERIQKKVQVLLPILNKLIR